MDTGDETNSLPYSGVAGLLAGHAPYSICPVQSSAGFTGDVTFDLIILQLDNHGLESESFNNSVERNFCHWAPLQPGVTQARNLKTFFALLSSVQKTKSISVECLSVQPRSIKVFMQTSEILLVYSKQHTKWKSFYEVCNII